MKFVSIDDVKVELMALDALKAALHENAFFKFMDFGRQGLVQGSEDAIDNFTAWIQHRGSFGRGRLQTSLVLSEYLKLRKMAQAELVDGLITRGSAGVKDAIDRVYLMTLDALVESKDKS